MRIVSFSGIDGAGKSTQIYSLHSWLGQLGANVYLLTFWDDVVVLPGFREFMSHAAFKGDQGIGTPARPLERRDKNVTSRPVSAVRFGLYLLDALNLSRIVRKARKSGADVVIFDRYIYDELANLPLQNPLTRVFIRLLLKLVPEPDVAYLIDADPAAAFARKPEYPLEFLHRNRQAYLTLSKLAGCFTIIEPQAVEAMELKVRATLLQKLPTPLEGLSRVPALP